MNYDIIVLGHFSKDKLVIHGIEINAPGCAVYYSGLALSMMNIRSGIITPLNKDDYYQLDVLSSNSVDVFAYQF